MEECKRCCGTGLIISHYLLIHFVFKVCDLCHGECVTNCNDLINSVDNRIGDTIRED
jgi:hypothetical protein